MSQNFRTIKNVGLAPILNLGFLWSPPSETVLKRVGFLNRNIHFKGYFLK